MDNTNYNTTIFEKVSNEYLDHYKKKSCLEMRMASENIKKRMEEFVIVDCCYKNPICYDWRPGDAELYIYMFPKSIQFSFKTQNPNEISNIKNEYVVFTLNTLSDLGILFALKCNRYDLYRNKEYETDVYSIFNTLGYQISIDFLGFERFDEVVFYERSRSITIVGGYKSGFFFLFEYYYS